MHLFHCWHEIEGSVRRIPFKSRCNINKIQFIHRYGYVNCTMKIKCCICGKEKLIYFRDRNIQRASLFKVKEI
jgi:hypothetical protein